MAGTDTIVEGTLQLASGRARFRLAGPIDAPTIMFCNSLMADMSMWDAVVARMQPGWRLLCYDMRGHGGTDVTSEPYAIPDLAADALDVIRLLGLRQVHLVGISLGGIVALQVAALDPSRVASLTLSSMGTRLPTAARQAWDERVRQARAGSLSEIAESTLTRWFRPVFEQLQPERVTQARGMLMSVSPEGYAGCAAALRDMDIDALPEQVKVPTLVIHGRMDPAWPVSGAQQLASRIHEAKFCIIEESAHMPCIEQPEKFATTLKEFLQALPVISQALASPRLPALDEHAPGVDPGLVDLIRSERGGRLLLLYKVLLNSPTVAFGWLKLLTALRQQTVLSDRVRELVILRIAAINGASYEFDAHVPFALAAGFDAAALEKIRCGELPAQVSDREQCTVEYVDAMTKEIKVSPSLFLRTRAHFNDAELLELTVLVGAYNMVSRVLVALDIRAEH